VDHSRGVPGVADEFLPVPHSGYLQAGFYDWIEDGGMRRPRTEAERFAKLREFAEHLGVDVVEHDNRSRVATLKVGPVEYLAHVNADSTAGASGNRVVSASEDTALIGGVR